MPQSLHRNKYKPQNLHRSLLRRKILNTLWINVYGACQRFKTTARKKGFLQLWEMNSLSNVSPTLKKPWQVVCLSR